MKEPSTLVDRVLHRDALSVVFQPVIEGKWSKVKLHSMEGLTRGPKGTNLERPDILFEYARRKGIEDLLDRLCFSAILGCVHGLANYPPIHVNLHASSLVKDVRFPEFLSEVAQESSIHLTQITIEIVEYGNLLDNRIFLKRLEAVRQLGIQIALDDLGMGPSNYKMILDVKPDYIKIDRYFVHGCHADSNRMAVLESIASLARNLGGRVIAEGVETGEDLEVLYSLGIELFQGHFFSRPVPIAELREILRTPFR